MPCPGRLHHDGLGGCLQCLASVTAEPMHRVQVACIDQALLDGRQPPLRRQTSVSSAKKLLVLVCTLAEDAVMELDELSRDPRQDFPRYLLSGYISSSSAALIRSSSSAVQVTASP